MDAYRDDREETEKDLSENLMAVDRQAKSSTGSLNLLSNSPKGIRTPVASVGGV